MRLFLQGCPVPWSCWHAGRAGTASCTWQLLEGDGAVVVRGPGAPVLGEPGIYLLSLCLSFPCSNIFLRETESLIFQIRVLRSMAFSVYELVNPGSPVPFHTCSGFKSRRIRGSCAVPGFNPGMAEPGCGRHPVFSLTRISCRDRGGTSAWVLVGWTGHPLPRPWGAPAICEGRPAVGADRPQVRCLALSPAREPTCAPQPWCGVSVPSSRLLPPCPLLPQVCAGQSRSAAALKPVCVLGTVPGNRPRRGACHGAPTASTSGGHALGGHRRPPLRRKKLRRGPRVPLSALLGP